MTYELPKAESGEVDLDEVLAHCLRFGFYMDGGQHVLKTLVSHVRKDERERCASVVDAQGFGTDFMVARKKKLSAAIRALGDEA